MVYITGDTHKRFKRIADFCERMETTTDDIMIILGDAGINFSGGERDRYDKEFLSCLPITLFCIHGNHEMRPYEIPGYKETEWHGGIVYQEEKYPNILFAKDGEIYDIAGKKTIAIGGAYSVDKEWRLKMNAGWWESEQPSEEIKKYVESQLKKVNWNVDVVLSHTTPWKYEPRETFIKSLDQSKVDDSTERWLDTIEEKLNYSKWYAGHFHIEKKIDKLQIMFEQIDALTEKIYE